jgi:nucleoside-diphosphate-sugar epimerase
MGKKVIFLTGATGFIGSNLVPKFIEHGYHIKALIRRKKENSKSRLLKAITRNGINLIDALNVVKEIDIIEGDITKENFGLSRDAISPLLKDTTDLFHCAAAVSFNNEKKDLLEAHNIAGTHNVLSFARFLNSPHIHYMSTAYVCGQRKGIIRENELNESQKFNNIYESIKCRAEELAQAYAKQHSIKITVYRPSVIVGDSKTGENYSNYGPYGILRIEDISLRKLRQELEKGSPIFKNSGAKITNGKFFIPLRVKGNNNKKLNLVTSNYALSAIFQIFISKENAGKTFHITNSDPPTVKLLKDCISELLDSDGIEFVGLSEFEKEPMKPWEKIFDKNIRIYTPYLLIDEPEFDDSNTRSIIKHTGLKQPYFDKNLVMKLLSYCRVMDYGKKIKVT